MTDEMTGAYPSQTEVEQPQGFYAVDFYEDGLTAFQAQPPSLREQLQVKLAEEKQPDQDIKAKEKVSKWERRVKFALQAGGVVVLATIAGATVAGCVPGVTGALPVTIVPDSATGNAPDAPHLSPSPTPEIMPSLSPAPSILPSYTPSHTPTPVMSPTEIRPSSIPTEIKPSLTPELSPTLSGLDCSKDPHFITLQKRIEELVKSGKRTNNTPVLIYNFGDDPRTEKVEKPVCKFLLSSNNEMKNYAGQIILTDKEVDACKDVAVVPFTTEWQSDFWLIDNNTHAVLSLDENNNNICLWRKLPTTQEDRAMFVRLFGKPN